MQQITDIKREVLKAIQINVRVFIMSKKYLFPTIFFNTYSVKAPVILIIVSFSASACSYLFLFASCASTNPWLKGMFRMQADELWFYTRIIRQAL